MSTLYEAYLNQNYTELKKKFLTSKSLFEDPFFLADNRSLYYYQHSLQVVKWKRPYELVNEPEMFINGINQNDVSQGRIGDCWFIAAICSVITQPSYIDLVIPKDQSFNKDLTADYFIFAFGVLANG